MNDMNKLGMMIMLGSIQAVLMIVLFSGVRFWKLPAWLPGVVMILYSYIVPLVLHPGNNVMLYCMGSLLAFAFGIPSLFFGYNLKKQRES